jgi:hypothetical protein
VDKARNDLSAAVPKFCLALEEHRRTPDGRVRTSQELLSSFFPHDDKACTDRIFKYLPNEVRGPIIAAWGIRGIKAALRDSDDKIQNVVHDALVAGDIDHTAFEDGLIAETLVRWVPLADLWAFWRGGKLSKQAIHKALSTAYELYLFDARWFLDTINAKGGTIKGTDVLAEGLTKDDLTQWVRRIHETGDGTPKGIVAALGWDKIVAKTPNEVLIAVLDAMVTKVGLVVAPAKEGAAPKIEPLPSFAAKHEPLPPVLEAKADSKTEILAAPPLAAKPAGEEKADELWMVPQSENSPRDPTEETGPQMVPMSTEEAINVVLDDEVIVTQPPTAPRMRTASAPDQEETEVKHLRLGRSERPLPPRGPSGPTRR